ATSACGASASRRWTRCSPTSRKEHGMTLTLPAEAQILMTREFDAPARLVYQAYTTPELVMRWWAGRRGVVRSADIDLRVGGAWRWVMDAHNGYEVAFHGVYREIVPDARLVFTEVFEGAPDGEALVTVTFAETEGRTTLSTLMELPSREIRDAI